MPTAFESCVLNGGRVVTERLKGGKCIQICFDRKGKACCGPITEYKAEPEIVKEPEVLGPVPVVYEAPTKSFYGASEDSLMELKKHFDTHYHR